MSLGDMQRASRRREEDASASAVSRRVIDESGANTGYDFYLAGTDAFDVTFGPDNVGNSMYTTYRDIDDLTIIGTISDDDFVLEDSAPLLAGASLDLRAGAGIDFLSADFSAVSIDFHQHDDGSITSNYGHFADFEAFSFRLGSGTNSVTTIGANDSITAMSGGNNTIDAGGGNDIIEIVGGQNSITAGAGNDIITVSGGRSDILAGEGDDTITASGLGTTIDGGAGIDSWTGTTPDHREGVDTFVYDGTGGTIFDPAGDVDTTVTGIERVELSNMLGDSRVELSGDFASSLSSFKYDGGKSTDNITSDCLVSIDASSLQQAIDVEYVMKRITFTSGNFSGVFSAVDDSSIVGSVFDDTFDLITNKVDWDGGDGIDTLGVNRDFPARFTPSVIFIYHADGTSESNLGILNNFERFFINGGRDSHIVGGDLDDTIAGGGLLAGGGGDDVLKGNKDQATVLDGGAGDDTLSGAGIGTASYQDATQGVTVAIKRSAQDTHGAGIDRLLGIANLLGSSFADVLTGDTKANTIDGGLGDDRLDGNGGIDTVTYASATAGVTIDLAVTGAQDTLGAGIDTLAGFENLTGSAFADILAGNAGNNVLVGGDDFDRVSYANATSGVTVDLRLTGGQNTQGAGVDTLTGFEGIIGSAYADTLNGDFQDNVIEGGAGGDVLDGTTGFDIAAYHGAAKGVTVDLQITTAQRTGGAGSDTLLNFEGLSGSAFDDRLTGDGGDNRLRGEDGNDVLMGNKGADDLRGGDGDGDIAAYVGGWARYDVVKGSGDSFTVTDRVTHETDTLSGIELVRFSTGTFAIGDTVNVGPRAIADEMTGLIEAGGAGSGVDTATGSVLANDRDANLATPGLGEILTVTGVASGRSTVFTDLHGQTTIEGRFGTLTIDEDGEYSYLLDNDRRATDRLHDGQTGLDLFSYQVTDAHGVTSTSTLALLIAGADETSAMPVHHDLLM